ncbi:hypothetical protein CHLNCDRAFT_134489 [Chlorella variabilis]|uniref:C3H1-type domain-containing protein n=1 Tax=Chlorella variabilis TaxID=554065 RepID=E1ZG33_CHLVA|nr:hypothetical protein CHLNCDRAFT_134489 [Chlorella variabilis]EFN55227.1 hypothetical protein CHLNCDRAFT_134489 [Chlorella variabilis]|eukprot:XP_005847329.1 hypothetical protein CHLNCDRAFT_134489 [Chlorella variabilis]
MPLATRAKGTMAVIGWNGDWRCSCGSTNKLWDTCVCSQPSPCREYVRGNCLLPKCRFPHPPFKIPEHLPKPADPIANPPAAAAKQKAAAQAAAAALAAEQSGPKEMAIVTWLGHWQCDCGKVHKLWDSCKCGQAPPCREWVRGQCNISKCRFPHPPFAIPANLPKPDDPIANPTAEQLSWSKEQLAAGAGAGKAPPPANGRAAATSSGDSTPVAGGSSGSAASEGGATAANGVADKASTAPPPSAIMQPGVSFRQALLKSQQAQQEAAAASAAADGGDADGALQLGPGGLLPPPPPPPPPLDQPPPPPPPMALSPRSAAAAAAAMEQQAVLSPRSLPPVSIAPLAAHQQQNGLSAADPVTAAPLSARSDPQVTQQQQAAAAAAQQQQKPLRAIAHTLLEGGLMDPAFYHALGQVDFLPDGHYQQDSITLEDQQRRMELFNAAVDSYIAAGVDRRSMLEIECAAKIGLSGGPLYYR